MMQGWKVRLRALTAAFPAMILFSGVAWALSSAASGVINDPCAFTSMLGTESGGKTNIVNSAGTAAGLSQVTFATMGGLGAVNCAAAQCPVGRDAFGMSGVANRDKYGTINSGFFSNAGVQGINNWNDYLSGPNAREAQMVTARAYFSSTLGSLDKSGAVAKYAGNSNNSLGINMNSAAMMQCANAGVGLCPYILSGGASGNRGNVTDAQIQEARNAITRSGNNYNPSGNCQPLGSTGNEASPNAAPQQNVGEAGGLYCDPQILQAIQTLGAQEVDRRMALAVDGRTGFTTLNGTGVLQAAGLSGPGLSGPNSLTSGSGTSAAGSTSFFSMSCLDRLMNSGVGGLSNLFTPPSWQQIQRMLLQAAQSFVCSKANSLYQQVTQPLSASLYRSVNLDGFSPGMSQVLSNIGIPTNMGLGGRVNIVPGPSGAFVPLEDRFNLMMGQSTIVGNGLNGYASVPMPSRLLGAQ